MLAPRISVDGGQETPYPGLTYYRISRPTTFHKSLTHGPMLTVVAQGRKLVDVGGRTLEYSAGRYLLIAGEISFTGQLLEASPERPYLAVCLSIPGDSVAKTLLALSDGEESAASGRPPMFPRPSWRRSTRASATRSCGWCAPSTTRSSGGSWRR